jgi:glycosyltransferase involved in cell wall biosynthesis
MGAVYFLKRQINLNIKTIHGSKIVCLFNSFVSLAGGDVRFIEIFRRAIGLNFVVITSALGKQICKEKQLTASYIQTTRETCLKNILCTYFIRVFKAISLNIKIKNGDTIYVTSDFLPDVIPAFFYKRKAKHVKWVQVIHHLYPNPFIRVGNFSANLFGYFSQQVGFALIKRRADVIIVVNPLMKQQLSQIGFRKEKIFVNYNGIDFDKIQNFSPSPIVYDGVFLGRLNLSKGVLDLLAIWKDVVLKNPAAVLAVIGGGDSKLENMLKNAIIEEKLEKNIFVLGYLEDSQAFSILKSSQVFVFPSHEEGFGIAILEAMACGLPVVAWDLPVYKHLFSGGILYVPITNINKFSSQITQLLQNKKFRDLLSNQAIHVSKCYSWDTIAKRELSILANQKSPEMINSL